MRYVTTDGRTLNFQNGPPYIKNGAKRLTDIATTITTIVRTGFPQGQNQDAGGNPWPYEIRTLLHN